MRRTIIDLPCMFGPLMSDWVLNVRGRSAGDGVTGTGQVAYGSQPRWEATLNLSGFRRDQVLVWRAIRARMRGRINILRVCLCDLHRASWAEIGLPRADADLLRKNGIPHSDNSNFNDDVGYGMSPTIIVTSRILPGAEQMTVNAASVGGALQPGQWFSYDDWPYLVTAMENAGGGLTTYGFEPPLRREIPAGAEITLRATALMSFTDDLEGRMPLDLNRRGETTINLLEWTARP